MLDRLRDVVYWYLTRFRWRHNQGNPALFDEYVNAAPDSQHALDIFRGQWSSELPAECAHLRAGSVPLFDDVRVHWFAEQLGGFAGKHVLELGPLEAGHTYMLEKLGVASILAIESNTRAYMKCLIVKELLQLQKAKFLCGDFMEFLRADKRRFDVCFASGVLYHMTNPVELIALLAERSDHVCFWTHYHDAEVIASTSRFARHFSESVPAEYGGFRHTLHHRAYKEALGWGGFCGAGQQYAHWMSKDEILAAMKHFGLTEIRVAFEEPRHVNGPSFAFVASRPENQRSSR